MSRLMTDEDRETLARNLDALEAFSKRANELPKTDRRAWLDQNQDRVDLQMAVRYARRALEDGDAQAAAYYGMWAGTLELRLLMRPIGKLVAERQSQLTGFRKRWLTDETREKVRKLNEERLESTPVKSQRYAAIAEELSIGTTTVREIIEGVKHSKKKPK